MFQKIFLVWKDHLVCPVLFFTIVHWYMSKNKLIKLVNEKDPLVHHYFHVNMFRDPEYLPLISSDTLWNEWMMKSFFQDSKAKRLLPKLDHMYLDYNFVCSFDFKLIFFDFQFDLKEHKADMYFCRRWDFNIRFMYPVHYNVPLVSWHK